MGYDIENVYEDSVPQNFDLNNRSKRLLII